MWPWVGVFTGAKESGVPRGLPPHIQHCPCPVPNEVLSSFGSNIWAPSSLDLSPITWVFSCFSPSHLNNQFLYDCMARLCSLAQPGTESNIFFFFIYTVSCFRKDLKRGDKHLVNTLDQMLKTMLGVVGNARENTFYFAFFTLSWDYNSLGDTRLS